jgi:hypothetical protein
VFCFSLRSDYSIAVSSFSFIQQTGRATRQRISALFGKTHCIVSQNLLGEIGLKNLSKKNNPVKSNCWGV